MSEHNLCEGMQSAYKAGHSTETALVRVKNDILTCMDKNQCVLLVLLDLSAAFDTVNHSKLLRVLQHRIGLGGTALMWFESYLRERTQAVAIRDSTAPSVELQRGVPQGSVLGPILFTHISSRRHRTPPWSQGALLCRWYAAVCFVWHQGQSIPPSSSNGGMYQRHQDVDDRQSPETQWQQDRSDNIQGS